MKRPHVFVFVLPMSYPCLTYGPKNGLQTYNNVKALIAVQPLIYSEFIKAMGVPGFLARRVNKVNSTRLSFDMNEKSFLPNVKNISIPIMVIQNENDPWTKLDFVKSYFSELKVEKEMLWVNLEKKRAAAYDYIGKQPKEILRFYKKYL